MRNFPSPPKPSLPFAAIVAILLALSFSASAPVRADEKPGQVLYNGIQLPNALAAAIPQPLSYEPMPLPYLLAPPTVIPIDVGRQLFVDDFLIEKTTLHRTFYSPKYAGTPVLVPDKPLGADREKPDGHGLQRWRFL